MSSGLRRTYISEILELFCLTNVFTSIRNMLVSFFKRNFRILNLEFSFSLADCHTKVNEHSLPYYLLTAERRIAGYILFSWVLSQCEMQTASSRFWTRVAVPFSDEDNHFTHYTAAIDRYLVVKRITMYASLTRVFIL